MAVKKKLLKLSAVECQEELLSFSIRLTSP